MKHQSFVRLRLRSLGIASGVAICGIGVASLAFAQSVDGWAVQDVGKGCKMILSQEELQPNGTTAATLPLIAIDWVGKCSPAGLATGPGTLTIDHQKIDVQNPSENRAERRTYRFTASNGIINGVVTWSQSVRYPGKAWVDAEMKEPKPGEAPPKPGEAQAKPAKISSYDTNFENGCEVEQIGYGCTPEGSLDARNAYLAEKGLARPKASMSSGSLNAPRGSGTAQSEPPQPAPAQPAAPNIAAGPMKSGASTAVVPSEMQGSASAPVGGSYPFTASNLTAALGRMGELTVPGTAYSGGYSLKQRDGVWSMDLSNCDRSGVCKAVQASSCFAANYATEAKANGWNNSQFYGRAFLNSAGKMCVDLTLDAGQGQVSDEALGYFMATFKKITKDAPAFFNRP